MVLIFLLKKFRQPKQEQKMGKIIHIRKSGERTESMKGVKAPEQTNRILKETKGGQGVKRAVELGLVRDETAMQKPEAPFL